MATRYASIAALGLVMSMTASADLTPAEADKLGGDLTPYGAIRAGNEAGTIPPWEGGIRNPAEAGFPDFESGGHHPNPYADDEPLFTITAANMGEYADKLTAGHKALLEAYPSYKMTVYPTRRSAAFPQRIYNKTMDVARTARLIEGGNGVTGAINGIPFPIPENGLEAIWNHILRYRTDRADRYIGQAAVTRGGEYTLVMFDDAYIGLYGLEGMTQDELDNVIIYFKQKVTSPPRLAGEILLVHETLDQSKENRRAWLYNPGQRRVRRAPNVAFDNPRTGADGLMTSDQLDMYNGSPERYDWELVGRKEIYVPYNSYELHSDELTYDEILTPLHINQDYARYELHRVWVVEARLKPGMRHIYKRRTFYIDEDSWMVVAVDQYDNRDQLWRVSEGHGINYYDLPSYWTTLEVHTDLQSGRYIAVGLNNEAPGTYDFTAELTPADFTPSALRREGVR
jgi:hypothetical protein